MCICSQNITFYKIIGLNIDYGRINFTWLISWKGGEDAFRNQGHVLI